MLRKLISNKSHPISLLQKIRGVSSGMDAGVGRGINTDENMKDIEVIPWRKRINSSIENSRHIRGANFIQLATVDMTLPQPKPKNRTVVFRGFLDESDSLKVITDMRSEKASSKQISDDNPYFEVVYWFPHTSEQYRIEGFASLHSGTSGDGGGDGDNVSDMTQVRLAMWNTLRRSAKEQFFWSQPGAKYECDDMKVKETNPSADTNTDYDIPDNFALLLLHPTQVKYLRLSDNYAQLDALNKPDNEWKSCRVYP